MPSPFPGMDPYLENPALWPDVHHRLISEIQTVLNPQLGPSYVARVKLRVYISEEDDPGRKLYVPDVRVEDSPTRTRAKKTKSDTVIALAEPVELTLFDEEIEEARLEIRHVQSKSLVTVIEVLSPTNKIRGSAGRKSFLGKRREILTAEVHWVEIDLLRDGMPSESQRKITECDYRVLVSRKDQRPRGSFWPIYLRQALPVIGIPLRENESEVPLDLGAVLTAAYDNAAYDRSIGYRKDPKPPLEKSDAAWARQLLKAHLRK